MNISSYLTNEIFTQFDQLSDALNAKDIRNQGGTFDISKAREIFETHASTYAKKNLLMQGLYKESRRLDTDRSLLWFQSIKAGKEIIKY